MRRTSCRLGRGGPDESLVLSVLSSHGGGGRAATRGARGSCWPAERRQVFRERCPERCDCRGAREQDPTDAGERAMRLERLRERREEHGVEGIEARLPGDA